MTERNRFFDCYRVASIVIVAALAFGSVSAHAQGWRDKLRETGQSVRDRVEESRQTCRECGKTIHGRDVCTSCSTRAAQERARQLEQSTRRACQRCGKTIHGRDSCTTCAAQAAQEKAREIEAATRRTCQRCGKTIHGRDTCTTCVAQAVQQKAREIEQTTRRTCQRCGKTVHGRDTCTTCVAESVQQRAKEIERTTRQNCHTCGKVIHGRSTCTSCNYNRLQAQSHEAYNQYAPIVRKYVTDEENQRRAIGSALTVYALYHTGNARQKQARKQSIAFLADNVRVQDSTGRSVTLRTFAADRVSDSMPHLKGTSLADDPIEAFTYLVVEKDKEYAYRNLRLIKSPSGEYVSMERALYSSSGTEGVLNAVETMESYSNFKDSLANLEDVETNTDILVRQLQRHQK